MANITAPSARAYVQPTEIPKASSYSDSKLVYTTLFALAEGDFTDPDPLNRLDWLDPLDSKWTEALRATTTLKPHVYHGEPITTISYNAYQTTSAWPIILAFNGYLHQDEIPNGTELELPDLRGFIGAYKAKVNDSRRYVTF